MMNLDALDLLELERHAPVTLAWVDVVVGYDFGILSPRQIQAWAGTRSPLGLAADKLVALAGEGLLRFEETLWAACVEATGMRLPRPGHRRWALAQDLWRAVLLKEALAGSLDEAGFGVAVEAIIDRVGCPEDMNGLIQRGHAWARTSTRADRSAVIAFVAELERRFLEQGYGWLASAAS